MTAVVVAEKRCTGCGETKPLSEFYQNRAAPDGLQWECKPCARERAIAARARRRAEMGEEAWLALQRDVTTRSRKRRNYDSEREYRRAQYAATAALVERHRTEFDHLLLLARRGELPDQSAPDRTTQ